MGVDKDNQGNDNLFPPCNVSFEKLSYDLYASMNQMICVKKRH